MTTKLTVKEYHALRRRPDRATLTVQATCSILTTCTRAKTDMASGANVVGSGGHNKFGAKPVWIDEIRFASKAEGSRFVCLKRLQEAGVIRGLELQPRFPFEMGGELMFTYAADFVYENVNGEVIIEDVKGVRTAVYKLKKRIVQKHYGIKITEIGGRLKNRRGKT